MEEDLQSITPSLHQAQATVILYCILYLEKHTVRMKYLFILQQLKTN